MVTLDKNNNKEFLINENDIIIEEDLDSGGQGTLKHATYKKEKVVIKTFKKHDYDLNEFQAYTKLKHPYMVKFYGYYINQNDEINLVLDYAEGEELELLIVGEELNYNQKLQIIEKLSKFLVFLRENHAIHRDLKPSNIKVEVIDDNNVELKVLDFGITKFALNSVDLTRQNVGTLTYAPPDIFILETHDKVKVSYKYDIWSIGLITSYLFSHKSPWKGKNNKLKNISLFIELQLLNKKEFPIPEDLDKNIFTLVKLCTEIDPDKRISPGTLLKLIERILNKEEISDVELKSEDYK